MNFRAQAQNLANHLNFDCITDNLSSGTFGQGTCLTPFGLGEPKSRVCPWLAVLILEARKKSAVGLRKAAAPCTYQPEWLVHATIMHIC